MPFVRERVGCQVHGVVVVGGRDLLESVRRFEGLFPDSKEPTLYRQAPVQVSVPETSFPNVLAYLQYGAKERDDSEPVPRTADGTSL